LVLAVFLFTFRLFELELTVVHNLAHGRNGIGRNLHQVQILFLRNTERFRCAHNPELFTRGRDDSDFSVANFFVDLMLVFNCSVPHAKK